jgi:hypothetical protein
VALLVLVMVAGIIQIACVQDKAKENSFLDHGIATPASEH